MVRKADEVLKDLCFMVVVIFVLSFGGYCFAQDYIESEDLSQVAVSKALDFDNMVILPTTETCVIRTIVKELDAGGNVVSQRAGRQFIYMNIIDNPETLEIDETCNDFNVFMQKLGLSKAKVKQAIREMELP